MDSMRAPFLEARVNAIMTEPDMHTRQAIIRVGGGRGFVVEDNQARRLVVTAAHCLPNLPPALPALDAQQKTYEKLLGPLDADPSVWCECVFVDPVADIAALGYPDGKGGLFDQARAYNKLVDNARPLSIAATKPSGLLWPGAGPFGGERLSALTGVTPGKPDGPAL